VIRIALDLDGVLADTMRLWIKLWRQRTGQELSFEELVDWDFWRELGITEAEFMRIMNDAWRMWRRMPPTEEELSEKVSKLKTLGKVDIVTARPRETEEYVLRWLERHRIPFDDYIWIESSRAKLRLGYDVYIDDSPLVAEEGPVARRLILLYDRPWNRRVAENFYVRRVKGLSQAYQLLKGGVG